jgi:hypothetical protein
MKKYFITTYLLWASQFIFSQSIVIDPGAVIDVGVGADICAGTYGNISGQLTGGGTQCNQFPLPVELSLFTASAKNQEVNLYWKTETEVNNFGFEIERSPFNSKSIEDWAKIGFVTGNGNSNSPKEYFYTDDKLIGGSKFKYRLKQIDNDGQFEYSDVVEIEVFPDKFALFQNYPNPFNPTTLIKYQLPRESKVNIKIYNILGEQVVDLVNEIKQAGVYEIEFNAKNLPSGTYIYRISAERFFDTKKMLLIR